MKIAAIGDWIRTKGSYEQGLALFLAHVYPIKHNDTTKKLIETGARIVAMKLLTRELTNFYGPEETLETKIPVKPQPEKFIPTPDNIDSLPTELKKVYEQIKATYAKTNNLQGRLRQIYYTSRETPRKSPDTQAGHRIAIEVHENEMKLRRLWFEIDYFNETGNLLSGQKLEDIITKLTGWLSVQVQYTNYCRKYQTRLKKTGSDPDPQEFIRRQKVLSDIKTHIDRYGI